mmetsp:Transcript_42867/g.67220  ORF Transcript_42867/g.67220 Transcript_42867/m.67220 type:complete len:382 (-) Transcript_42867:50-1195(-)
MYDYWNVRMALMLIYHKRQGKKSDFAPYLEVMPESYGNPLNWTKAELQELQWAPFIEEVQVEQEFFKNEMIKLQEYMKEPPTEQELLWALMCTGSRTFTADFGGEGENGECMCAVADMVNHHEDAEPAFRWNPNPGVFELFSPLAKEKGEEVCISYGDVNNEHLLHYYGFVPETNKHEHIIVNERELLLAAREKLEVAPGCEGRKFSVLRYLMDSTAMGLSLPMQTMASSSLIFEGEDIDFEEDGSVGYEFNIWGDGNFEEILLMYARALVLTEDDLEIGPLEMAKKLQGNEQISQANEIDCRRLLEVVLQDQLEQMSSTSLEEDRALLKRIENGENVADGRPNLFMALRYRSSRKQLLLEAIDALDIPKPSPKEAVAGLA